MFSPSIVATEKTGNEGSFSMADEVGDAATVSDVPTPAEGSSVDGLGTSVPTESDDDEPQQAATTTTSIIARTAITNFRKDMCTRELSTL